MTFREAFYNVKRLLEDRLHDFGLESANASTMGWKTMLSIVQNTRITINVPSNLTYTDEFSITGILEISTHSRLNGKTVKLKVGDTIVATTTTNVNGEYSFTQSPVSAGTHSFQVIFEGTDIYTPSESSIITRTAGKETSVMNLDAEHTRHYGESVFLNGFLLTNDGEPIRNASVKCYINGSLFRTLSTFNSGEFNLSITINSFDSLNVQFVYEGDSNYTSVSASQTIEIYQPVLRLTSDKDILSYADNESATITAQLIDNAPIPQNLTIANQQIKFLISFSGTSVEYFVNTDNTGKATFIYNSQGIGDVEITAKINGTSVSKTYAIEDCKYFNDGSSVGSLEIGTGVSCTSNGDYITITTSTSGEKYVTIPVELASGENWIFEAEIGALGTSQNMAMKFDNTNTYYLGHNASPDNLIVSKLSSVNNPSHTAQIGDVFKVIYENGTTTLKCNDTTVNTGSVSYTYPNKVKFYTNNGRVQKIKNIKVKPL